MTTPEHSRGSPARKRAVVLALRFYGGQLRHLWRFTGPALLLPAVGNTCISYVAPLIVAQLVGRLAGHGSFGPGVVAKYLIAFAGVLLFAELLWRIGIQCLNRLDGRGIENLYVIGMDELLAKDAAFFHDNFAGSLTKRVLSFASRFEDFADNLAFNIVANLVPLVFASVVLWRFDPWLVVGLVGLIVVTGAGIAPLIRRRQKLVDQREEAIARVSGHVADSLMNMDTIRAFAAERREAAEHRLRVADQRQKSVWSWDYSNLRIDGVVAPMSVLTNVVGLVLAVGRSGGGKSTLLRLLLRMMDIDGGRILIGGQDITRLRQADLRSLISYVPQAPAMFHRTLRDNIAFARPGATEAEIRRAAQAAYVTEFADALPEGFDTMVGERGVKLSGGQQQRVALARAILRDAPFLLLDEATSALDSESELLIQQALWRLMEGRTALVVAHRLSTVARMDQLIVLDRGRIIEQGTHAELLGRDGTYARLWRHQSGGFLEDDLPAAPLPNR